MSSDEVYVLGPVALMTWLRSHASRGIVVAAEVQIKRAHDRGVALDRIADAVLPVASPSDGSVPVLTSVVELLVDRYREAKDDAETMAAHLVAEESATIGGSAWPDDVVEAMDRWAPVLDDDGGAA